jgi:hypothetical protein
MLWRQGISTISKQMRGNIKAKREPPPLKPITAV